MKALATADVSLFFYWVNERHRIYLAREEGKPKPWTDDPILRDYKFTNVYRQLDRGTKWLTDNFIQPHINDDPRLLAANICWYRMFNWTGTGELLGWQTESWEEPDVKSEVKRKLWDAYNQGKQVFTNAHIVYSPPGVGKIDAIVDVCADLWELVRNDDFAAYSQNRRSLEDTFEDLRTVDCVGGFMAYEMVTDMRWVPSLLYDAEDIMTWANPGPGAIRGLRRLGRPHAPRAEAIRSIEQLLRESREGRRKAWERDGPDEPFKPIVQGPTVLEDHMPVLEMRDIEHSLCEFDKYCRVKFGEGEPRMKFNGR